MVDLLSKGISFSEYMNGKEVDLGSVYNNTHLSTNIKKKIKDLREKRIAMVFSEGYCPDCTVVVPFVKRLQEENSNIELYFFKREGNEEFLESAVGEARIPTILVFDEEFEPKGAYIELPEKLKNKIQNADMQEKKEYVKEYREGKYNDLLEEELIEIFK